MISKGFWDRPVIFIIILAEKEFYIYPNQRSLLPGGGGNRTRVRENSAIGTTCLVCL